MISSDSPEIMSYVRGVFARMRLPAPSGSLPLDRALIVTSERQRGIRFNGEPLELTAQQMSTDEQLGFYGSSRLFRESFRRNATWRSFHGAALLVGERAVVLAADSGIGKTTLALALVRRGARFYSDEFVFVRRSDRYVSGYPRTLLLREPTPALLGDERLAELCGSSSWRLGDGGRRWDFVDPVDLFGPEVLAEPAPLGAIVLLERRTDGAAPTLRRIPTALASLDVSPRLHSHEVGFGRLVELAELFAGVPTYGLSLGDLEATADMLWEALT
jgi:hypothetical protein